MSRAVASLLATLFGDVETLGTGRFLAHHPARTIAEFEIADLTEVTSHRFPDCIHPWLLDEVRGAVDTASGSVLQLLRAHTEASTHGTDHIVDGRFPCHVFREVQHPGEPSLGFDVADGHLHSGASVPMPVFFDYIAARGQPFDLKNAPTMVTAAGRRVSLGPLLAGLRTSLRLMWCARHNDIQDRDLLSEFGFSDRVGGALDSGTYWANVRAEAFGNPVTGDLVDGDSGPGDWVNAGYAAYDGLPSVASLVWRFMAQEPLGTEQSTQFLEDTVRALFVVESSLRARPGEGLSRFANRFRFLGDAWKAAGATRVESETKARIIRKALQANAFTDEVVGAEFRKTIKADKVGDFQEEVEAALVIHVEAFREHLATGTPMALCMPVGFRRRATPDRVAAKAGIKELRHVLNGCEALRRIAHRPAGDGSAVIEAIRAFDVAGDELGSANWPFMIGAQVLKRLDIDLVYSIHAGESFVSHVNGVRRVAELFGPEVRPKRVGHALALSPDAANSILRFTPPAVVRWEAIMDLAWIVGAGLDEGGSASELLHQITAPRIGFPRVDVAQWIEANSALSSLESLCETVILEDPECARYAVRTCEDLEEVAVDSALHRAIAGLTWGAEAKICGVDVRDSLDAASLQAYRDIDTATAEAARTHALQLVKSSEAVIESCPTSNVLLAGLDGYQNHPLWELSQDVCVTVSSDDPAIFGSTIVQEFARLLDVGDRATVEKIAASSVDWCAGGAPGPARCSDRHDAALMALRSA